MGPQRLGKEGEFSAVLLPNESPFGHPWTQRIDRWVRARGGQTGRLLLEVPALQGFLLGPLLLLLLLERQRGGERVGTGVCQVTAAAVWTT